MKYMCFPRRHLAIALLALPLLTLSGCDHFSFFKPKPPPQPTKSVQIEQFLATQAQADLALQRAPDDQKLARSYSKKLNGHMPAKGGEKKELTLSVLALEYTRREGAETQTVLVPVEIAEKPSFTLLRRIQKQLSRLPHTLHNMRAYYVTTVFPPAQPFPSKTDAFRQELYVQRQMLLEKAVPILPYDHARLQLQLAEFFLSMRVRDAAYLSLEGAKDTLTLLAEKSPGEKVAGLLQKAEMLAVRLNKEMPYKL